VALISHQGKEFASPTRFNTFVNPPKTPFFKVGLLKDSAKFPPLKKGGRGDFAFMVFSFKRRSISACLPGAKVIGFWIEIPGLIWI
jgi:hypothetical protein